MVRTEEIGGALCLRTIKAQILVRFQENEEDIVYTGAPAIDALRMTDFILDITIQQRIFGIGSRVNPGCYKVFRGRELPIRLLVLGVVFVEARTVYVTKVALNQGVVATLHIVGWLPENRIHVRRATHYWATMVSKIVAS